MRFHLVDVKLLRAEFQPSSLIVPQSDLRYRADARLALPQISTGCGKKVDP